MGYDRRWCEEEGSEDSCGRTIWALGVTMRDAPGAAYREWAAKLYGTAIGSVSTVRSPRAQAFVMLGAGAVLDRDPDDERSRILLDTLGNDLLALAKASSRPDWTWFEGVLAYDNARLPEALLIAGRHLGRADLIRCGLDTLSWLAGQQRTPEGYFRAVGSESFGRIQQSPLPYDQQPLEAQAMIDAAVAAWSVESDRKWVALAENAYRWFLGQNDLDMPLATPANGGCFDGLTPHGTNQNQGAESLLALQLSSCAMNRLSQRRSKMADMAPAEAPIVSA
jgi:hypothetical protein